MGITIGVGEDGDVGATGDGDVVDGGGATTVKEPLNPLTSTL